MKLYSGPLSMFGAKCEMAVIEKGIDLEVEHVPFSLKDNYEPKSDLTWEVNPKGQIPYLVDGDLRIYDTSLLFEFFEELAPEPPLWPADPRDRARARLWELESDELFFESVRMFMPKQRSALSEDEIAHHRQEVDRFYNKVDKALASSQFITGSFSFADLAFYPAQFFAGFLGSGPGSKFSNISRWKNSMLDRASVDRVMGAMREYLVGHGIPVPE